MSAGDEALKNAMVAHATAQDVPSVECAKDGIAFRPETPEVLHFSGINKRIVMERMRTG
ncbi:MAG TPA: hypothetical protein VFC58_16380 [Desulfosporosinus sp.]|nr:hypothetical protein [Desulfosporosinus sp.]